MALFPPSPGGGSQVGYGHKGKGVLIHLLIEEHGHPIGASTTSAAGDEKKEVEQLVNKVRLRCWSGQKILLEADKGYDSWEVRQKLLKKKILPIIPYKRNRKDKVDLSEVCKTFSVVRKRWKVERTIAWIKRKFRRLMLRWERRHDTWYAFVQLALISYWLSLLLR